MSTELTLPSFYSALNEFIVGREVEYDTGMTLSGGFGSARTIRRPRVKITYRIPDSLKIDTDMLNNQKRSGDIYGYYLCLHTNGSRLITVVFEML